MNTRRCFALLACAALLAGCGGAGGGSGSGGSRGPTEQTRQRVEELQRSTIRGMSQTGIQAPRAGGMLPGPDMAPGIGGPTPRIGGMIRFLKPPSATPPPPGALTRGDGGSTDPGGVGPGDPPGPDDWNFYYDEWLELWVQVDFSTTTYRMDFFEDEAKTRPAGYMSSTWPEDWSTYPVVWRSDYEYLAGPFRGSRGSYVSEMTTENSGSMTYDGTWDGSRYQGQSTWSASGSSWTNRTDMADGAWYTDRGDFRADGSGSTLSESSHGYRSAYTWNADGSGRARLEGPDAGLPATIVWNQNGEGTITWADGTVEEFHWWFICLDQPMANK